MVTDLTEVSWESKIKAFLHDPPDKSLCISGHKTRAEEILRTINIRGKNELVETADRWASSIQRISWEHGGKEPLIDFCGKEWGDVEYLSRPVFKHTLSGKTKDYIELNKNHLTEILEIEKQTIKNLTEGYGIKERYFRIWRYLRDELQESIGQNISRTVADEVVNLPADTRIPDHTIWDHLDVTSAIYGAMERGRPSLLMFKISPVQSFIINSRKEEDLWAGSHILSYLAYQGIKVIIERYGPDAFVYPYLRGLPFVDCDYFNGDRDLLRLATIPNKFLAIVAVEDCKLLKREIEASVKEAWDNLAGHVEDYVDDKEKFWRQIEAQWSVTIDVLEFPDNPPGFIEDNKSNLPLEVYEKYSNFMNNLNNISKYNLTPVDNYGLIFELLQSIVDYRSKHNKNHVSVLPEDKCTMCGERAAVTDRDNVHKLKNKLKKDEKLCGVCLVKRFYRDFVKKELWVTTGAKSVSEVAMMKGDYLEQIEKTDEYKQVINNFKQFDEFASIGWDVEYIYNIYNNKIDSITEGIQDTLPDKLFFDKNYFDEFIESMQQLRKKLKETYGAPPTYYGILLMDGDNMGMKLTGDDLKNFREYLHPEAKLPQDEAYNKIFDKKRRLTPTIHTAISRSLTEFALKDVVRIVGEHRGELIYTGGDDVLALLPTDRILDCAYKIQRSFNRDFDGEGWRQYPNSTMSAGIMIVKYNYPLYDALNRARKLENRAKEQGRNRFCIGFLKGSQMYETGAEWELLKQNDGFLKEFTNYILNEEISTKLIYDFMKLSREFKDLEEDAFKSLLKVELERHARKEFREKMKEEQGENWAENLANKLISARSSTDGSYLSIAVLLKILFEMKRDSQ